MEINGGRLNQEQQWVGEKNLSIDSFQVEHGT